MDQNNYWRINTEDYTMECKKNFDDNKIVMGLGADLDLKEFINSDKKMIHEHKEYIKKFLNIKKGDYIEWILLDRINTDKNNHIEVNKILGQVTQNLCDGYEFIKNIGHAIPVKVIDKSTIERQSVDYMEIDQISNLGKGYPKFKKLNGYKELYDDKAIKNLLRFKYFGLENIEYDDKEIKIKFKNFPSEENKTYILHQLGLLKKDYYVLGEFISKNIEKTEVFRLIGTVKDMHLKGNIELVLEIKGQEKCDWEYDAFIDINMQESKETNINFISRKLRKNKNVILYGPPGTGKTYGIADEIVKIINPFMIISEETNREAINKEVKKLQKENRIKYCTFHQSYGYEEFIEGLRSDGEGNFVVEDGILKEIAMEAMFNALVYEFKSEIVNNKDTLNEEELKAKKKQAVLKYINEGNRFDFFDCDEYVIVIDEINRGNISKIFGELITLLEEDKRLSKENEMIIKLPYSKENFILPPNLHLIGTMNTSDKSIAPIDIALRRRFKFIERMPEEKLLTDVDGIELDKMLKKINDRIEYLYDRDHMIGHAYFINLDSLEDIISTLKNKIIPLLQEYFYEDWNKIGLVLGGIGSSENDSYIIYKKDIKPEDLFKNKSREDFPIISKYYIKNEISFQEIKNIYE
jgi:5-methylcytosine-specific restriction protein B